MAQLLWNGGSNMLDIYWLCCISFCEYCAGAVCFVCSRGGRILSSIAHFYFASLVLFV